MDTNKIWDSFIEEIKKSTSKLSFDMFFSDLSLYKLDVDNKIIYIQLEDISIIKFLREKYIVQIEDIFSRMLKESTLRNQLDFKVVYNKGKSKVSRFMVIIYKKNGLKYSRLAYVSSKKVGNSVRRNRSRRLMREAYRLLGCEVKNGYDVIFIARNSINDHKCEEVRRSMYGVLRSEHLLDK